MFQRIAMFILKKKQAKFSTVHSRTSKVGGIGRTCFRVFPTCTLWLSLTALVSQTPVCRKRRGQESVPFHSQHHICTAGCSHCQVEGQSRDVLESLGKFWGREWQAQNLGEGQPDVTKYHKAQHQWGTVWLVYLQSTSSTAGSAISKGTECQELHSHIENILVGICSHSTHTWSYKQNWQTDINFCFHLILHPSVDIKSLKFFSNIEYPILTVSAPSLLSRLSGSLFTKESHSQTCIYDK